MERLFIVWRRGVHYRLHLALAQLRAGDRIRMKSGRWLQARRFKPFLDQHRQPKAAPAPPAPEPLKVTVDLDATQAGLNVSAALSTGHMATTARATLPWWVVGCFVAGGVAGATVAQLQNRAEERRAAESERRARLRRARHRRLAA